MPQRGGFGRYSPTPLLGMTVVGFVCQSGEQLMTDCLSVATIRHTADYLLRGFILLDDDLTLRIPQKENRPSYTTFPLLTLPMD